MLQQKSKLTLFLVFAFFILVQACRPPGMDFRVPEEWYRLPEEGKSDSKRPSDTQIEKNIADLLSVQSEALDSLPDSLVSENPTSKPSDWVPWHLAAFMADFSVSASGVLGALLWKGTPSVSVTWKRKNEKKTLEQSQPSEDADLVFTEETTQSDLEKQIQMISAAVEKTGKIKNGEKLRKGLQQMATEFQDLFQSAAGIETRSEWKMSRLRLDVGIEASGSITPVLSVGGDLRLRFEWFQKNPSLVRFRAEKPKSQAGLNFAQFIRAAAVPLQELSSLPHDISSNGFVAQSFRIGLGATRSREFAIAKTTTSLIGHVYFSRVPSLTSGPFPLEENEPIAVLDDSPSIRDLQFATVQGVSAFTEASLIAGAPDSVVYKVKPEEFRKGLRKAMGISSFFVRVVGKNKPGGWNVTDIKSGFDLSVIGTSSLARVTGVGSTEITFVKQEGDEK